MSGVEGVGIEGGWFDEYTEAVPVKYSKRLSTDANGDLTINFPAGMFVAAPVVTVTVESPVAGDQYLIQLIGTPTTAVAVLKVRKFSALSFIINILGFNLQLFTSPGSTPVHIRACEATA
jgi:hypothetical protein